MFCPFSVALVGLAAAAGGILPLYWFIYKYRFYQSNYKCYFHSLFKTEIYGCCGMFQALLQFHWYWR